MSKFLSELLDRLSGFFAHRKGLLILVGIALVLLNLLLQLMSVGWLSSTNLLLHLGVIIAMIGVLLAWAL